LTVLADAAQRERLRTEFDTTFFVQAGAGTGKTTEVVARIVALVASGNLVARHLVAITFTEAAAAELRARVREGLEAGTREDARTDAERERCAAAARGIGDASIDTIHAFAGALLRTYPLEAGLPPNFEMLDAIQQEIELDERFRAYFDELGKGTDRDLARRALLLGLTPDQLHELALRLHDHYDLLAVAEPWAQPAPPPDPVSSAHGLGDQLVDLGGRIRPEMVDEVIAKVVFGLGFAADRLKRAGDADQALAAIRLVEKIGSKHVGNKGFWDRAYGMGSGAILGELKDGLAQVEEKAGLLLDAHRSAVLVKLLGSLREFVLRAAADRKRDGRATFHDLLTWARDLLRDDLEVRRRAQLRWSRIFVDEFQDTDPLQAELAFYLAAAPDSAGDWRQLPLTPGKLCVVGDPKQSIYRFRRADIALYQAVENLVGTSVELSQNFRSVPRVLDFVNQHYGKHITWAEGIQPRYIPLAAEPHDTGTGLWTIGEELDVLQPEVWAREAEAVARAARRIVADGWEVSEGTGAGRRPRAARFSDIAVLIPSRTNLRRLERSFDAEDVPYRIESGELIVQTQEVRDLVSCLRTIDDPSDQVALVAALRSVAFGCSDVELLQWVESGGRLSYEFTGDGTIERVQQALARLLELHQRRHRLPVPALIQELLDERLLVAGAFGVPHPRESWRRYRYVLDRARAFEAAESPTLRGFVDWIEGLQREQIRDVSPAVTEEDEDAVRVLTVHGSKGLEFPIVIVTGWGSRRAFRPPAVLPDRVTDKLDVGIGRSDGPVGRVLWATPGYAAAEARERQLADAEGIRLSYVAATRARDHLVVSLYRRTKEEEAQGKAFAATLADSGIAVALDESPPPRATAKRPERVAYEDIAASIAAEGEWLAERGRFIEARGALRLMTATGLKASTDTPESQEAPLFHGRSRGRGGTSVGRAVHAALQSIDLGTLAGLDELAAVQAAAEGIPRRSTEVAKLVRRAASSDAVKRAVASGRYWREVPVGAPVGAAVLEGFIDLLYEGPEGLVVVDYKTDSIADADVIARAREYRLQGATYALLVAATTHRAVAAVDFVFAARDRTERIEDLDQAVRDLRAQLDRDV
jgi:ATP-dependent helicase/nuclease subunit A